MKKKTVLKNAGVLLIVLVMVLSTVVVTGNVVVTTMDTILSEDFEGGSMPPPGWSVYDYGEEGWGITSDSHSGNYAAIWMGSVSSELISPVLDCSAMNEVYLSFWHKQPSLAKGQDTLSVYVSIDGGAWNTVADYTGEITGYTHEMIDLTGYISVTLQVKFTATSGGGAGVYLDDIGVSDEVANNSPETPSKLSGPTTGEPDVEYSYTTSTTDPDGDRVQYGLNVNGDFYDWTNLYNSEATCTLLLTFDEGTYELKVKARDEYGAESGYSPILTVVISEESMEYMGLEIRPLGVAELEIVDTNLSVSNCVSGQPETDGVWVNLEDTYNAYTCTLENPFEPDVATTINFECNGMIGVEPFSMGMKLESKSDGSVTINIPDVISAPSMIIATGPSGDIVFHAEVDEVGDLGYIAPGPGDPPILVEILLLPVCAGIGWNDPSVVLWTWEGHDVDELPISKLMVAVVGNVETDSYISDVSITATGIDEFTMLEHYAYELNPPAEPTIDGPTEGNAGTSYTYTITNPGVIEVEFFFIDWDDGSELDTTDLTAPGVTATASHTWSADGTYTVKARAMNTWGMMSDWTTLEVSMPKNKAINTMPLFMQFLENFFERYPNAFPILRQILLQ